MLARPAYTRDVPADVLEARPGLARLAPAEYPETPIWGYGGGVPGPVIRLRQGDRVIRRFLNNLPQASTVHWHGIRIDNAMDGVAGLTQSAVPSADEFLYDFLPPDAGTYWYHPHNRSWEQMARGLYGALIVEEPDPPEVDRDAVLLIDDWRLDADASIHESFGNLHDWAHAGRIGNWITVNGKAAWKQAVSIHERIRLRLANTANSRIFTLELLGLEGWVVALDGQPLPAPQLADRLILAPAQRVDLIVDVLASESGEAFVISSERDGGYSVATFTIDGTLRGTRLAAPAALPPNPMRPLENLGEARRETLLMEGGAMGSMRSAMMDGRMTSVQELAENGKAWAMNGMTDLPDSPLLSASLGETVIIRMVNDTAWPHAMHLHGHHFRKIGEDGAPGPLRDTILIERGESADIAFVAENPGDWLLHCHMLEHSPAGMMMWIIVA